MSAQTVPLPPTLPEVVRLIAETEIRLAVRGLELTVEEFEAIPAIADLDAHLGGHVSALLRKARVAEVAA